MLKADIANILEMAASVGSHYLSLIQYEGSFQRNINTTRNDVDHYYQAESDRIWER